MPSTSSAPSAPSASPAPDRPTPVRPATGVGRWSGKPVEQRQQERRQLLLDAAFDVLGTAGLHAVTVRGMCEATRLNPRYFYESFTDLDALLVATYDRAAEEAFTRMALAIEGLPDGSTPADRTFAGIDAFIRFVTADPRLARVLVVEGLGNEAMSRRRFEAMQLLASLVAQNHAEAGSPTLIVQAGAHLVVGGVNELLMAWIDGHLATPVPQLIEHVSVLINAVGSAAAAHGES